MRLGRERLERRLAVDDEFHLREEESPQPPDALDARGDLEHAALGSSGNSPYTRRIAAASDG